LPESVWYDVPDVSGSSPIFGRKKANVATTIATPATIRRIRLTAQRGPPAQQQAGCDRPDDRTNDLHRLAAAELDSSPPARGAMLTGTSSRCSPAIGDRDHA
jgi:hypothetical protein